MEQVDIERFALEQALYKYLAERVSTKDPDSDRAMVDEHFLKLYEQTGAKSFEIRIDGQKVGTYSVRVKKGARELKVAPIDERLYREWAIDHGYVTVDEKAMIAHFEATGEEPDGAEIVTIATPEHVAGGTVKVDEEAVAQAFGEKLPARVAGLLGV